MGVASISSEAEFDRVIAGKGLVVCDWYATWCGPCKAVAPRIEQLSTKYPHVTFIKVDVDNLSSLAQRYSIRAMPTFTFFANSIKLGEVVGASVAEVENKIHVFGEQHKATGAFTGKGYRLGGDSTTSTALPVDNTRVSGWNSTNIFIGLTVLYLLYKMFYGQ